MDGQSMIEGLKKLELGKRRNETRKTDGGTRLWFSKKQLRDYLLGMRYSAFPQRTPKIVLLHEFW